MISAARTTSRGGCSSPGLGHTCSLSFRLDQLDEIQELGDELWLILEERDGIAKGIHLAPAGFELELYHIIGPPLGGTST